MGVHLVTSENTTKINFSFNENASFSYGFEGGKINLLGF